MEFVCRGAVCALLMAASQVAAAADQGFYFGVIGGNADYKFDTPQFVPAAGVLPPVVEFVPRLPVFPPGGGYEPCLRRCCDSHSRVATRR